MLRELLKDKRDQVGRAIQLARELGEKMRKEPDKAKEIEESFNKAHAEATAGITEVQRIEREIELESAANFMGQPGPETQAIQRGEPSVTSKEKERKEAHKAAFSAYLRHGVDAARECLKGFGPSEVHALLGTQADLGGFLVPEDFRQEVIRSLAQQAVIRSVARVVPTSKSALVFPAVQGATGTNANIYASDYAGNWRPEGYVTGGTAPTVQNQPKFGQERIPVHGWQPDAIEVSRELLEDSAAPLDSILAEVIAETLALDEDSAFLNGNGVGRPQGVLQASPTTVNSGNASALTYNGLLDLFTGLPAQYRQNGRWVMAAATYGAVLKLADSQSRPIFTPNELPGTLWGKPILFSEFMPSVAANNNPIIFGDWRYYVIADRQDLRVQRLTERYAPNVGILPTARLGGQPVRINAFRVQKVSA